MKRYLPQILLAALVLVIVTIIAITPIGIGSPYTVMERMGLYLGEGSGGGFVPQMYSLVEKAVLPSNLQTFLIQMVRGMSGEEFNLIGLGILYGLILCAGLVLLSFFGRAEEHKATNWILAGLLFIAFADFAYTEYFNSLYVIPLVMTLFLVSAGIRVSMFRKMTTVKLVAFVLFTALLIISGSITGAIMGIALAISLLNSRKKLSIISAAVLLVIGVGSTLYTREINYEVDIYNSVFQGVTQYESVTALGLPAELDELKGIFYSDEIAARYNLGEKFYNNISYRKILKFYMTHPVALVSEINGAALNGTNIRTHGASNYPWGGEARWFSLYSTIKYKALPVGVALVLLILVFAGVNIKLRSRGAWFPMVILSVLSLVLLVVPIILSGRVELGSGLYGFNIVTDCMIIAAVVGGMRAYCNHSNALKEKYGLKQ